MKFESSIFRSGGMILLLDMMRVLYIGVLLFLFTSLLDSQWPDIIILTLLLSYFALFFFRLIAFNNDLEFFDKTICIRLSVLRRFSFAKKQFPLEEIEEVVFREERYEYWSEGSSRSLRYWVREFILEYYLPTDYKWLQIRMKDGRRHTYYFFGLDYDDAYSGESKGFISLFLEFARRGIDVRWRSTKSYYYKERQEFADNIINNMRQGNE